METHNLAGDVAIVTGAARGIDRAIALKLARHGCHVACCDINDEGLAETVALIEAEGGSAEAVHMDVSNTEMVNAEVKGIYERHGKITILVNGAFWSAPFDLDNIPDDSWKKALDIMLGGYMRTLRAVHPYMKASGGGRIVQISSTSGKSGCTFGGPDYATAKAGIIGLTKYVALHWCHDHIRANTICPGATESPVLHDENVDQKHAEEVRKAMPLERLGTPEDIAKAAYFLLSDLSDFITGITLDVAGGRYIYGN